MGTILRATFVYWLLLIVLRLIGRRVVSQLSPFEFIVVFLLGGMSIQAIVSDDRSVTNAVMGILAIAVNHVIVSAAKQRFNGFRKLVDGTPIIVVRNGEAEQSLLHGLRMSEEDVLAAARQSGIRRMGDIACAIVERDGNVTIFKSDQS